MPIYAQFAKSMELTPPPKFTVRIIKDAGISNYNIQFDLLREGVNSHLSSLFDFR